MSGRRTVQEKNVRDRNVRLRELIANPTQSVVEDTLLNTANKNIASDSIDKCHAKTTQNHIATAVVNHRTFTCVLRC